MAEMMSIKMSKFDNQPWGFRLQGGIDFCAPLTVQKVSYVIPIFYFKETKEDTNFKMAALHMFSLNRMKIS